MDEEILIGLYKFSYKDGKCSMFIGGLDRFRVLSIGTDEEKKVREIFTEWNDPYRLDNVLIPPGDKDYNKLWNILHGRY